MNVMEFLVISGHLPPILGTD